MRHHNVVHSERRLRNIQIVLMDKQEMRMKFIQLMNDAQKTLGRKETVNIIKDLACLVKAFLSSSVGVNIFVRSDIISSFVFIFLSYLHFGEVCVSAVLIVSG